MQNHLSAVDLGYHLPDGSLLFKSLNFSFGAVRTGLVGANGIGKTTLLEILVGRLAPTHGNVTRGGRVSYLPQTARLDGQTSVAQAIKLDGVLAAYDRAIGGEANLEDFELISDRWDLPERIQQTFVELGIAYIALDRSISSLSGGELTRIRIAGLLLEEPDFLILDEPTNHLDLTAREFIYDLVAGWKKGLIVVSHDRRLLSFLDQTAELNSIGLHLYGGNYEFYRQQREAERAAAEETFSGARQRLKHARATAQRARERQQKRQSSGRKRFLQGGIPAIVAGGLRRAAEQTTARLKGRHEQKVADLRREVADARDNLPAESQIKVDLVHSPIPSQKRMLELVGVNYRFAGAKAPLWATPMNFELVGPVRIWLKGDNGAGKSTLLDLICGRKRPETGAVKLGTSRIGLLDQPVSVLDESLTVLENLRRVAPLRPEHELRTLLGRFLFIRDDALKPAAVLSGGERMRAGLACLLGADQSPEILIIDEPTNNLDLASIEALISALQQYRGVLIAVSHDLSFIEEIGIERIIELPALGGRALTASDSP